MFATRSDRGAALLLVATGAALLGGALAFQYLGGLAPCEMCIWQRWAIGAAVALGLAGLAAGNRVLVALAIAAMFVDTGIAVFHVGVEQHWWKGITECAATTLSGPDLLGQILAAPLVRCDAIAWSLLGISMAGWNALVSLAAGGTATWLMRKS